MCRFSELQTKIHLWTFIGLALLASFATPLQTKAEEQDKTLRVALLPILDALPFYVAEARGYFSRGGYTVTPVPVASGLERDQLMQAHAIDAMLNEMTTTATFNREGVQVKILGVARIAYDHFPMFRILAAPESGIKSPSDLAGIPIGVSKNTIIEYVTDRLLTAKGLDREKIVKESVPVIPERYQLLMQGRLKAATLPDPQGKSALESGALPVVDDSAYPHYSVSVLSFSVEVLEKKADVIRHFLKGWDKAAAEIDADPEAYRPLLLKKIRVPENIQRTYSIPPFPRKKVPEKAQWEDVMAWMVEKHLLDSPLPYEDSVTEAFFH
jgi:NitT/TauT family transport system substrate-binding protein